MRTTVRRILAAMVLLVATAPAQAESACAVRAASAADKARCALKPGDLAEARLGELHPTQPSLGYDEIHYRLGRFAFGKDKTNRRFDDWCETAGLREAKTVMAASRLSDPASFTCKLGKGAETAASREPMKTAVVGPAGRLYLTDGHHTFTSFMEAEDGGPQTLVRLRITHVFGDLDEAAFWEQMRRNDLVWLRDAEDREIAPAALPASLALKNFGNDRYRGLLYFARDIGFEQVSGNATFQEFYWGRWLRKHPTIKVSDEWTATPDAYLALLEDVTRAQAALPETAIVSDGRTAKQLGRIRAWNDGDPPTGGTFGKIARPYADEKPGKLAYAFRYKASLAGKPPP